MTDDMIKIAAVEKRPTIPGEHYKRCSIRIGESDIAALTLTGLTQDGITASVLSFGGDGAYRAWIVDDAELIPPHYSLVYDYSYTARFFDGTTAQMDTWLRIYDDTELVAKIRAKIIRVYRAGEFGCLIYVGDGEVKPREMELADLIASAAKNCGSLTALARILKVSNTTLQYWKSGARAPRADKLAALKALAVK